MVERALPVVRHDGRPPLDRLRPLAQHVPVLGGSFPVVAGPEDGAARRLVTVLDEGEARARRLLERGHVRALLQAGEHAKELPVLDRLRAVLLWRLLLQLALLADRLLLRDPPVRHGIRGEAPLLGEEPVEDRVRILARHLQIKHGQRGAHLAPLHLAVVVVIPLSQQLHQARRLHHEVLHEVLEVRGHRLKGHFFDGARLLGRSHFLEGARHVGRRLRCRHQPIAGWRCRLICCGRSLGEVFRLRRGRRLLRGFGLGLGCRGHAALNGQFGLRRRRGLLLGDVPWPLLHRLTTQLTVSKPRSRRCTVTLHQSLSVSLAVSPARALRTPVSTAESRPETTRAGHNRIQTHVNIHPRTSRIGT